MTEEITNFYNAVTGDMFSIGGTVYLLSDPNRVERRILRFYRQGIGGTARVYAVTDSPSTGEQHIDAQYLASFTDAKEFTPESQQEPAGGQVQPCPKSDAMTLSNNYLTPDGFKRVNVEIEEKHVVSRHGQFSILVPDYVDDEATQKSIAWKFLHTHKALVDLTADTFGEPTNIYLTIRKD